MFFMRNIACLHWRPFVVVVVAVVVVLVNNKKYTFNSTVNFEKVSKMLELFLNKTKQTTLLKELKNHHTIFHI